MIETTSLLYLHLRTLLIPLLMRKSFLFFFLGCLYSSITLGQLTTIPFEEGDYQSFRSACISASKPHFVYVYMQDCIPCKKMEKETFTDKNVLKAFEGRWSAYKVDNQDINSGIGLVLENGLKDMPALLFFNEKGRILEKISFFVSNHLLYTKLNTLAVMPPGEAFEKPAARVIPSPEVTERGLDKPQTTPAPQAPAGGRVRRCCPPPGARRAPGARHKD